MVRYGRIKQKIGILKNGCSTSSLKPILIANIQKNKIWFINIRDHH